LTLRAGFAALDELRTPSSDAQCCRFITHRVAASGRPPARSAVIRGQQFSGASTGGLLADRTRNVMKQSPMARSYGKSDGLY
jgi:hypothetical protein